MRLPFIALIAAPVLLAAQAPTARPPAHPDYAKADLIRTSGAFVLNATVNPVWLQDSTRFYYRSASPKGEPVVYLIDPVKRTKAPLFDNVHLAQVMSLAGDTIFDPTKIPNFRLSDDERALKFNVGKRQFECTISTYACMVTDTAKVVKPDTPTWAVLSPDKKWEAFSHNYNIYVRHAGIHDFKPAAAKKGVGLRADERGGRRYALYPPTKPQPRLVTYPYAAPGDSILIRYDSYVLDVTARTSVKMQDEKPPTIVHGMSGLAALKWSKKSEKLYLLDATRGAKRVTMLSADLATGETTPVTQGSAATFVELVHGGGSGNWEIASNGDDIFFPSQKDGWLHIYRYDANGKLKNQLEAGSYTVERIAHVADSAKKVYLAAWGKEPGVPYYAHLYSIGFDGAGMKLLTPEDGNHRITFVPTGGYFLDAYSRVDAPPVTTLRSAVDGSVVMNIEKADVELLRNSGWTPAEIFTVKARGNVTTLYGLMYKPSNFDQIG